MKKKTVVICGPFKFPFGDAGANRVFEVAKTILLTGREVLVIGNGILREEDKQIDGKYMIDGIQYDSIYSKKTKKLHKGIKLLTGGLPFLIKFNQHNVIKAEAIISYGGYFLGNYILYPAVKFLRKEKFIVDVVEWYSPDQFPKRYFNLFYIDAQIGVRYFYPKIKNIITISSFLENYYIDKGCIVVVIPPLTSLETGFSSFNKIQTRKNSKLRLIYAGTAGKKDYLDIMLIGISKLTSDQIKQLEINIYGYGEKEIAKYMKEYPEVLKKIGNSMNAYGRIPRSSVLKEIKNSHFTILMRPISRYSKAGFPSKVPESLSLGTPVILNYTSDLQLYVKDFKEGLIVKEFNSESFTKTLIVALSLSPEKIEEMSNNAKMSALKKFHPAVFVNKVNNFLMKIT